MSIFLAVFSTKQIRIWSVEMTWGKIYFSILNIVVIETTNGSAVKLLGSTRTLEMQGCHMVKKSQEKLRKIIKVKKSQAKMGVFEKSQKKN